MQNFIILGVGAIALAVVLWFDPAVQTRVQQMRRRPEHPECELPDDLATVGEQTVPFSEREPETPTLT